MADATEQLTEYKAYDRRCGVVSSFQVFFDKAEGLSDTVRHFERFPRYEGADGNEVTPDFTVLFEDGTLLIAEIANLARTDGSLDDLLHQLTRYAKLIEGPSARRPHGGHDLSGVAATDLLVLTPIDTMNAMCDRIDEAIVNGKVSPAVRPTILGYSYDDATQRFVFNFTDRATNPRLLAHGREPSLDSWLAGQADTLYCGVKHFGRVQAAHRFMNDAPPKLYMAVALWLDVLPGLRTDPMASSEELLVKVADIAERLRDRHGYGDSTAVGHGLEFLREADLARPRREDWKVFMKQIARGAHDEVRDELLRRVQRKPSGAAASADERAAARERREHDEETRMANEEAQLRIDDSAEVNPSTDIEGRRGGS